MPPRHRGPARAEGGRAVNNATRRGYTAMGIGAVLGIVFFASGARTGNDHLVLIIFGGYAGAVLGAVIYGVFSEKGPLGGVRFFGLLIGGMVVAPIAIVAGMIWLANQFGWYVVVAVVLAALAFVNWFARRHDKTMRQ
jgi:hypothetical protein